MGIGGLSATRLDRMRTVMRSHTERGRVPGLVTLVGRRGELHVDAFGTTTVDGDTPVRRDTIFRISSMSKPVATVAALTLVEECVLRLDDPVDGLLPELADRRVLRSFDAEVDDTVPARRPITLRDLLTFRLGYGVVMAPPGTYPIQRAMAEQGLADGPPRPNSLPAPEEYLRRLGAMPLQHQPGERWLYNTGSDILGVLIARAAGQPLEVFLRERLFDPLGMTDTGFSVPADKLDRFLPCYATDFQASRTGDPDDPGRTVLYDGVEDSQWNHPPAFPSAAGGLVSTVDDYHAFARMLLNAGRHGSHRVLSRPSIQAMTTDQLTPTQKAASGLTEGYFDSNGWGFGLSVVTRRTGTSKTPGQYGWDGGLGTSWASDPAEDLIGILLTQRAWDAPIPPPVCQDFWTSAYQAIDD